MYFEDLNLISPILKALQAEGYHIPTPIQEQCIGKVLEGRDLLGTAQTGTGKTAAFAVPILQLLSASAPLPKARRLRALVLSPTRELAIQIKENFVAYGRYLNLKCAVIYGGVSQVPQVNALNSGLDILVATPGRLLDLMGQGHVHLENIKYFVLDEADHMLDMGFIHDVKKIIEKLPEQRQNLMFSATMPPEISQLADRILQEPVRVAVSPAASTVDATEQSVYFVEKADKKRLLLHLLQSSAIESALVFSRTKHGADKIVNDLARAGINAAAIHGNKSQSARQMALNDFKAHKTRVLVATDIAARGIDVSELSHVINYDLPDVPETYVHRIGRTGRAGLSGTAFSFCDGEELEALRDIQKLIGKKIPVAAENPYAADFSALTAAPRRSGGARPSASSPSHSRRPGGNSGGFRPHATRSSGRRNGGAAGRPVAAGRVSNAGKRPR